MIASQHVVYRQNSPNNNIRLMCCSLYCLALPCLAYLHFIKNTAPPRDIIPISIRVLYLALFISSVRAFQMPNVSYLDIQRFPRSIFFLFAASRHSPATHPNPSVAAGSSRPQQSQLKHDTRGAKTTAARIRYRDGSVWSLTATSWRHPRASP